jgi:hypothetical protein
VFIEVLVGEGEATYQDITGDMEHHREGAHFWAHEGTNYGTDLARQEIGL